MKNTRKPDSSLLPCPDIHSTNQPSTNKKKMQTPFNSHRLRTGRVSATSQTYLVTTTTHQRQPIFESLYAGRIVVQSIKHFHDNKTANSLAYVIMPDHIHWLFQLTGKCKLSRVIASLKSYTAKEINLRYSVLNRKIWQQGFHDHAVRTEDDIKPIARYIIANPLRAGLVERVEDYSLWDAIWV